MYTPVYSVHVCNFSYTNRKYIIMIKNKTKQTENKQKHKKNSQRGRATEGVAQVPPLPSRQNLVTEMKWQKCLGL